MTGRLRVALIGPGSFARRHLEVLSTQPDVELVGILGRRLEPAADAARRFGGRPYDGLDRLLDRERPDAAWICVPPDQHGTLELALVERGIHLFVEKPLAASLEPPIRIGAAIEAAGVIAAVGYHWRALDTLPEVEDLIAAHPVRLVSGQWHDSLPATDWLAVEARSGGQIVEQATHLVDLSRRLLGEATVMLSTADRHDHPERPGMTIADVSTAILRYGDGAVGAFSATCILGGPSAQHLALLADGLAITIRQDGVTYEQAAGRGEVRARRVATGNDPIHTEDRVFLDAIRTGDRSQLFSRYADALLTHRLTTSIRDAGGGPAA